MAGCLKKFLSLGVCCLAGSVGNKSLYHSLRVNECQCDFDSNAVLYFLPTTEKLHRRKHRVAARRRSANENATSTIQAIAEHQIDAYEGWQQK
jgi:hypothetical protein